MTVWERFPTDDMSLRLLAEACRINPDTGQTHLQDFLQMGTVVKSVTCGGIEYSSVDEALADYDGDEPPILEIEHEPGFAPHSEHTVIISLVEEIQRLRAGTTP